MTGALSFKQTTSYWITFTAHDDATREVLAVRVVFELAEDHMNGRAEIPAFGIVIENDARALIRALEILPHEVAHRHSALNLRFGAMTQATAGESRAVIWSGPAPSVISRNRYELIQTNPNRRPHDLALLSDFFEGRHVAREWRNYEPC